MKIMKNLFILTLMVASFLLVACANSSGGDTPSPSGDYVAPTLPSNKGTDPFGQDGTFFHHLNKSLKYEVNTSAQTISCAEKNENSWVEQKEYTYSYDGTANPPTITVRLSKMPSEDGSLVPIQEAINRVETQIKEEVKKYILKLASETPTYAVDVDTNAKTVYFTGQYDPTREWYDQPAGFFHGNGENGYSVRISNEDENSKGHIIFDVYYDIVSITKETINCETDDESSTKKSFHYTITGTGPDAKITINLDTNITVVCKWNPGTL